MAADTYLQKVRREEAKTWRFVAVIVVAYLVLKWLI